MSTVPDRARHQNRVYQQLPLYMKASELHSPAITKGDHFPEDETHDHLMRTKLNNAYAEGLVHDIKEKGVLEPVKVDWDTNTLVEGHHRVAAANRVNPDMMVPIRAIF